MSFILAKEYPQLAPDIERALGEAVKIVKRNTAKYGTGDLYPAEPEDDCYIPVPRCDLRLHFWLNGFWPGQLWLAYEASGDEELLKIAQKYTEDFYDRVYKNDNVDWHHDIGFLYTPSCVADYKLTGSERAHTAAKMAAYSLSRRFRYKGEFIQCMLSEIDEDKKFYKFIVDTMLNLPLLFWATEDTGDMIYRERAQMHLNTTLKYAMRPDGTTFHHVLMDNHTGEMIRGLTWQGANDDSCWSRGQAWVICGLALAYSYMKDERLIGYFEKATDYFVDHLPADNIPYWDFIYSDGSGEPRDSSAAAVAVCGILEMARHIPADEHNMRRYIDKAADMLRAMISPEYAVFASEGKEGLLKHGTTAKPQGISADSATQFGDYFYLECLMRATRDWKKYW